MILVLLIVRFIQLRLTNRLQSAVNLPQRPDANQYPEKLVRKVEQTLHQNEGRFGRQVMVQAALDLKVVIVT
ncbi:hypothetical protein RA27_00870 [Ruegeria sp. ANG-R]|nr:hypothetical protein RA27_00870 [Ruegeria sp. ANG-R]